MQWPLLYDIEAFPKEGTAQDNCVPSHCRRNRGSRWNSASAAALACPRQNPDPTTKNASFREKFTVESPDTRCV